MAKYTKVVSFNASPYKRSYVSPFEKYTRREREVFYNTNLRSWSSYWEAFYALSVQYKGGFITPLCYKPLLNKLKRQLIRESKTKSDYEREVIRFEFLPCRFSVLHDYGDDLQEQVFADEVGMEEPPRKSARTHKSKDYFPELLDFVRSFKQQDFSVPYRDEILLKKLRDKIRAFVYNRSSNNIKYYLTNKSAIVRDKELELEAQMESMSAQGEKTCPDIVSQGNTLQESQRGASVGKPAKVVNRIKKFFNRLASAESSPDYAALTDRFFPHGTYEWKGGAEHPTGKTILNLKLPYDFIINHQNAPNCTLFNSYSYWDGDMEVKIMVNSNKFQVGQLQMSWYYGQDYENNFSRRDNIYTASQQAHCLVSASTSNEGVLYIPFRYYKPKMGCKKRADDPGYLNMGSLSVRVINELSSPSTVYKACTFTISFRFINSNFSGMVSRDLGQLRLEANMFAVRAAMRVLEEMESDPQRDNPPVISPPASVVPWSAHSWSIGDKLTEPTNTLRLSAPGQTPHPAEVTPEFDEMSIQRVVSVFGLMNIQKWGSSSRSGTLLFMYDGCPIQSNEVYYKSIWDSSMCYAMPPVAVVSNMFAYWRGSLELRLDVIASPFHTGRLLIAYIPRVMDQPTLEQAKGSPHMIIDLQGENRQFVFKIPYIADRPWWHNKSFNTTILPPSRVYCFVLNELVPMDNVVNSVDINVYMRGCEDFEVSVPVSPRIGLSTYNATVEYADPDLVYTRDGYTPVYIGEWRNFENGKKKIMRYGNVSDHVTQFIGLKAKVVYVQDDIKNNGYIYYKTNAGVVTRNWWIVGIRIDGEYNYAAVFSSIIKAKLYASTENNDKAEDYIEDSDWFVDRAGKRWDSKIYFKPVGDLAPGSTVVTEDFERIELVPQMDERESVTTTCNAGILKEIDSTSSGMFTFGESFNDFKTICRRYQLYAMIDEKVFNAVGRNIVKIPILPQGLVRTDSQIASNAYYNINREGIIPLIASAYRFYRGGLRFKFVWKSEPCTIRVEHRPDERLEDMNYSVYNDHRGVINDGYAIIIQNMGLNNVIEFEVPFYQCGILGLLQNPLVNRDLESYHFSLGNLYFSCLNSSVTHFKADIYYSLADDCRFSVFQGFPMVMWAPNVRLEAQMGLLSDVTGFFSSAKETTDKINKLADKVEGIVEEQEDPKSSILSWIGAHVPKHLAGAMVNGISQIFHCFINPSIKTVAWAIASFMASIGVLCTDVLMRFSEGMVKLLSIFRSKSEQYEQTSEGKQESDVEDAQLEANMSEEQKDIIAVKAGIISTVISSICASLGSIGRIPRNVPDFMRGIWNNVGKFSLTSNALCNFFKNNLIWITNCYKWVVAKICPGRSLASELQGADEELKQFVEEALVLTSAANERKVEIHPKWNMRVYKCAAMASVLIMRMSTAQDAPRTPALYNLINSVLKLRDKLVRFQLSPPVRFEPYVLCFSGGSNIGKSHLCQDISKHLLKEINYKTYHELIYTRTPGNPYWNQLRNQPVCLYDDFCAIGGEHGLQQAAELFCLKSRAIFNPPQAEIADKHIRYNPLIVLLATNQPFPKVAGVENNEAFYRRRDVLIDVRKDEAFYAKHGVDVATGSPKEFKIADIKNFEHLIFRIANNVRDSSTAYSKDYKYVELLNLLSKNFKIFYSRELELYQQSLDQVFEFYPDDSEDILNMCQSVQRHEDKIADINKYRFGSTEELKVMCGTVVASITNSCSSQIEMALALLKTYSTYDIRSALAIVTSNKYVLEYIKSNQIWSRWFDDLVKAHTDKMNNTTVVEAVIEHYSRSASSGSEIEAQMNNELTLCSHMFFTPEFAYTSDSKGGKLEWFFYHPTTKQTCSEECCDEGVPGCPWRNQEEFEKVMEEWMNDKYRFDRQNALRDRKWSELPKYFKKKYAQPETPSDESRAEAVRLDVETWLQWGKRVLGQVGSGIWTALVWASKVIAFLASTFCVYRLVSDKIYPENVGLRYKEKSLDKMIPMNEKYQETLGKKDAELVIQKELINKEHFTQKDDANNEDEPNMVASGDYKTYGKQQPQVVKDVAVKLIGNMASQKESALIKLLKRNSLYLEANVDGKILIGRILGLVDHYALCVDHYNDKFSKLPPGQQVFIVGNNFRIATNYDKLVYTKFKDSSLGYIKLPIQVPPFKNLIKHIATQRDHRTVGPLSFLVETNPVENSATISEQYCEKISGITIPASNGFNSFVISDGYKYARGGRGICGSALVSTHLERAIYGIHVAGDVGGRVGISEAITCEQFEHLVTNSSIHDVFEGNMSEYYGRHIRPNSNHCMMGIVLPAFGQVDTGKSKVIPTECNGQIFPNYCAPPVLSAKDERIAHDPFDPLQMGIDKHGMTPADFPEELVLDAYNDLNNVILSKVKPLRSKIGKLSKSVAIVGDPSLPDYDKLDFNTSEGFPYVGCRPRGKRSKKWLLDLEQDSEGYRYNGCDKILTDICKIKKYQRLQRILPFTVFTDCLKDRKLPIEKAVTPGKVRIFSISPLDFTIQCRQYFLDFNIAYKTARLDAEHAIGIDVNSLEWTALAYKLLAKGNNIVTADYSNYGPTLMLLCVKYCIIIIRNWYKRWGDDSEDNDVIREMMGYEMMHCIHLARRTVYRTLCGLPSGGPLTVILNTLVGSIYIRVAWKIAFTNNLDYVRLIQVPLPYYGLSIEERKSTDIDSSFKSMNDNIIFILYGDDVIKSVADRAKDLFNCVVFSDILNSFNITVKNATKGDQVVKYNSILDPESTFLKCQFIPHPIRQSVFLAGLDKNSVEDTCNWTFKEWEFKLREISLEACEAGVRNAFGWGPSYYNMVYDKMVYYWQTKGEVFRVPSWSEIDYSNYN